MVTRSLLLRKFYARYAENEQGVRIFFAPGRVNIIGEHIDYNGGPVMPAGISLGIYLIIRKRSDTKIFLKSCLHSKELLLDISAVYSYEMYDGWTNYAKGVFRALKDLGLELQAADILIYSDLPGSAGLSSSAALEVVFAYGMWQLSSPEFQFSLPKLALLCQKVENEFVGVHCGIMDQFASAMAKKNHVILLHCDTLQYDYASMNLGKYVLVIMNTNKSRNLAGSEFNQRRMECEQVLQILNKYRSYEHLSMAKEEDLLLIEDPLLRSRARHVISETQRVYLMRSYLNKSMLNEAGALLNQSHQSLRDDFQVSCKELDMLVAAAQENTYCIGARMTGAGFGGCAIAFVEAAFFDDFVKSISKIYWDEFQLQADFYQSNISDGVREL